MAKAAFTEHPMFMRAGNAANDALHQALVRMGMDDKDLFAFETSANRIVDDMTKLLLRAHDAKQARAA